MQDSSAGKGVGQKWKRDFKNALDLDSWGQVEEARESYEKLARNMIVDFGSDQAAKWSERDLDSAEKLAVCLRLRCNVLKRGDDDLITLDNMKVLASVFENLFVDDVKKKKFPLTFDSIPADEFAKASAGINRAPRVVIEEEEEEVADMQSIAPRRQAVTQPAGAAPSLQPRATPSTAAPVPAPSPTSVKKPGTVVTILIDKIGFKEETHFVDPRITVSVVSGGRVLDGMLDAKIAGASSSSPFRFEDKHMIFGCTVILKQTQEAILPGAAIFFEFKHYKVEKHKWSTKCWAFLEREDIRAGQHVLELYKKPTDLKRKKLSLLTVKPLYLHLSIDLSKK